LKTHEGINLSLPGANSS